MDHQAQYKNVGKDSETLRKSRNDQIISIRKEKRDDIMSKRRNIPQEEYVSCFFIELN